MSFTSLGYPAAFASEGNPSASSFPGEFDPYVHTERDTLDVDDETGTFSFEVNTTEWLRLHNWQNALLLTD